MLKAIKSKILKLFILTFLFIPSETYAVQNAKIIINASNFKNSNGIAHFSLFNQSKGFPDKHKFAHVTASVPIIDNHASVTFENVSFGEYAVSVLHDENNNYKMDVNFIGIPKEGFGISNNYKGEKNKPAYNKAKISLLGNMTVDINMVYFD